ncbi:hypothetical protein H5T89_02525 [bacterium]|nr:hypothetical protein [bacterium]
MGSRYEIFIWLLTFTIVTTGVWSFNNPDMKLDIKPYNQKEKYGLALDELLICPVSKRSAVMAILEKELPKTKLLLLKRIEIKNNDVYVILYNDVLCRLGSLDDLSRKLDLILKILNTAEEQGVKLKEIDVRSLRFPTILEGESEDNE